MTPLMKLLDRYQKIEKGKADNNLFAKLIRCFLAYEPRYKNLYNEVSIGCDLIKDKHVQEKDSCIDLIAKTATGELHAVMCGLYPSDHVMQKADIKSFLDATNTDIFAHIIIVSTAKSWSNEAKKALSDSKLSVTRISLRDLEYSRIDWSSYKPDTEPVLKPRKVLRQHQEDAIKQVRLGLKKADRGMLIMACGTGKTLTALKLAERTVGADGRVLFLVPSLALLSQTLTEWTQESEIPLRCFAVCSDSDVGKKRSLEDDYQTISMDELSLPATTDAKTLAEKINQFHDKQHMTVVFSTYHSIDVCGRAQELFELPDFDLVVCDEAHRTTGAVFEGQEEDKSVFVKIHDAGYLRANKRLYMTATPRIYKEDTKENAKKENITLCSMDDPETYGEMLYLLTFSKAVSLDLLVDYKVVVLEVEESHINRKLSKILSSEGNSLKVSDAAKIIGCWKALSKQGLRGDDSGDAKPMKRAVAFCQVIEETGRAKTHRVASKNIAQMFEDVVNAYQEAEKIDPSERFYCVSRHVDGTMNAGEKDKELSWLKQDIPDNKCHILSNVRCLSEGVDVPSLDAVLFLTPRNSMVDVVQSVGRVMRKAPGKKRGYVILPVVIPPGIDTLTALNDNETYKVVWQVLQALRSHDDRFDSLINKADLELNASVLKKIEIVRISELEKVPKKRQGGQAGKIANRNQNGEIAGDETSSTKPQLELPFNIGEIERAIYAKIVQKCGNRHHWEDWANDIAKIARTHIDRINGIIENPENKKEQKAFKEFAEELRDDLNDSISDQEVVEMLAQHLVTKPVFEALFADYSFTEHNPISRAMQKVLVLLKEHRLEKEADTLNAFYESVKQRAEGIESADGKQKIVVELYDKFFRNAFPRMTERLGIVYTPVEVVDFIIHSVDRLLKKEFGQTLGSKGVHILDPFTGTGTFITRLLQSGLIKKEELAQKYKNEIHANEIVLLAYYIAAINIESVYHSIEGGEYIPFEGICLTDTFQLYEKEDLISRLMVDNSERRTRQKNLDIRVIIGNPPYSAKQESANDNNQNVAYPSLDARIRETYTERSTATNKNALYDSYIRAIRWASDRVGKSGIVGFVTNAGFVEANTAAGLRQCLVEEFSSIYVFHLRGNQRTSGETSRKEGGKIFGSGSRAPIAITFLIKNPKAKEHGKILFHDIGDYLTRAEKLQKVADFQSVEGITSKNDWKQIVPDEHGDWLRQRDESFGKFIVLGDKKRELLKIFGNYSQGLQPRGDAWFYNYSFSQLAPNIQKSISFFNSEVDRYEKDFVETMRLDDFVRRDPTQFAWYGDNIKEVSRGIRHSFKREAITRSLYRPYSKVWVYFDEGLMHRPGLMPRIFPDASAKNLVIQVNANYSGNGNIALISNALPDLHCNGDVQAFPLYLYDPPQQDETPDLFNRLGKKSTGPKRRDAITDEGLKHFQTAYPKEKITKEDIFYYVYGLLHSPEYRERYADNLSKELPRIPCVKKSDDFWAFSKAGRALADLHIGYETVKPYSVTVDAPSVPATALADLRVCPKSGPAKGAHAGAPLHRTSMPEQQIFRVEKMRYGKTKIDGKTKDDKTVLIYNNHITLRDIPLEAYDYIVNGKSALDWVVERQCVKTDKDSGIVNDANDWAVETMGNAKYPLELFMRVITVSLETMAIVKGLPGLEIGG